MSGMFSGSLGFSGCGVHGWHRYRNNGKAEKKIRLLSGHLTDPAKLLKVLIKLNAIFLIYYSNI